MGSSSVVTTTEQGTRRAIAWAAARELAHAAAEPTGSERVALDRAAGLALAEDVVAATPIPAFDTAAMDGYAVAGPGPWTIVGASRAGRPWPGARLAEGSAVGISTGAVVPPGARAVVPVEVAAAAGGVVTGPEPPAGKHVRYAGEDAAAGACLVPAGTRVGPALIGLAASCGYDELVVRRAPRVRAIVTGDELALRGPAAPGRVRDALGPVLPGLVGGFGGRLDGLVHVSDEPETALGDAVDAAVAGSGAGPESGDQGADIIVVTGSTSVGVTDGLRRLLAERDARWVVDGVACRPGHPQLLARPRGGPFVIGLPGNPFAALVAAYTLLGPLIAGMSGVALAGLPQAPLTTPIPTHPGRTRIVPVVWDGPGVRMLGTDHPAFLNGAALGDALAAVPAGAEAGQPVPLILLRG
jgi:molybdopterin molybdotransferase